MFSRFLTSDEDRLFRTRAVARGHAATSPVEPESMRTGKTNMDVPLANETGSPTKAPVVMAIDSLPRATQAACSPLAISGPVVQTVPVWPQWPGLTYRVLRTWHFGDGVSTQGD